ncbi:MAG: thermonuclease family protein [Rhodospirillales bacterium]|nr:thermonuclease family protein [Rhodospirillales bacterium]
MNDPNHIAILVFLLVLSVSVFAISRVGRRKRPSLHVVRNDNGYTPAEVARVIDGDTVDVIVNGRKTRIRLDAIDCPEDGQEWGETATHGLIKLIGGRTVYLEVHGFDPYDRTLATIYLPKGRNGKWQNVNERMVMLGHAWVMRQFYNHLPPARKNSLNRIEAWAKSNKVGLWRKPNPLPPWKWRGVNRIKRGRS